MTVQDWFEKRKEAQIQRRALEARVEIEANPDLWTKCVHCDAQLLKKILKIIKWFVLYVIITSELMQGQGLNNFLTKVLLKRCLLISSRLIRWNF